MPQKTATPTSQETPMRPEIVCMTSPILSLLLESLVMTMSNDLDATMAHLANVGPLAVAV